MKKVNIEQKDNNSDTTDQQSSKSHFSTSAKSVRINVTKVQPNQMPRNKIDVIIGDITKNDLNQRLRRSSVDSVSGAESKYESTKK